PAPFPPWPLHVSWRIHRRRCRHVRRHPRFTYRSHASFRLELPPERRRRNSPLVLRQRFRVTLHVCRRPLFRQGHPPPPRHRPHRQTTLPPHRLAMGPTTLGESHMKAWLLPAPTGIESMTLANVPDPAPAAGELLLSVQFAALNP